MSFTFNNLFTRKNIKIVGYKEEQYSTNEPVVISNLVPISESSKRFTELQRLHSLDCGQSKNNKLHFASGNNGHITKKPPHSPVTPLSPKMISHSHKSENPDFRNHKFSLLASLDNSDADTPRERSKTISVMSPVRNNRESTKWTAGSLRMKETTPRSGINPSFVFLQLYHTAQLGQTSEKPILVTSQYQKAIGLIDFIPPFQIHKIGVLYVGPGQCNNQTGIQSMFFNIIILFFVIRIIIYRDIKKSIWFC